MKKPEAAKKILPVASGPLRIARIEPYYFSLNYGTV
jgi:hypothetical protein